MAAPPVPASQLSQQRITALRLAAAYNAMDVDTIISLRSPNCIRYIQPSSQGHAPQTVDKFAATLRSLTTIFHNFELKVDDIVEDLQARKIGMWVRARADTEVGEYKNEYVWKLEFDETGEKIVGWNEFTDASMLGFFPKLREAWLKKERGEAVANGTQ